VRALLLGQGAAQKQPERRREMTGAKEKKNSFNQAHKPPSRDQKTGAGGCRPTVGGTVRPLEFVSPHLPYLLKCYTLVPLEGRRRIKRKTKISTSTKSWHHLITFFSLFYNFFFFISFVCFIISNDGGSSPDFPRRLSLFTQRQKILIGAEKRRSAI
jgi:hypothetical protein